MQESIQKKRNRKRKSNLDILLNGSYESHYWIGFLLADGTVYKNNRISIVLSVNDLDHLQKYATYINSHISFHKNGIHQACRNASMDVSVVAKLKELYDIHHQKTFNPPNIEVFKRLSDANFLALLCGFIDGDGCIKKQTKRLDAILTIKIHKTWKEFLDYLLLFVQRITGIATEATTHLTKDEKYVYLNISHNPLLYAIKKKAEELSIPIMTRKWDNIVFTENRTTIAHNKLLAIKQYVEHNEQATINDIAIALNLSYGNVIDLCSRNNLPVIQNKHKLDKHYFIDYIEKYER